MLIERNWEGARCVRFAKVEATEDEGVVEGLASAFDTVDTYGTRIAKGAFRASLAEWRKRKRTPPMYLQHNSSVPVGRWERLAEDEDGLRVQGRVTDSETGRHAFALVRDGTIGGLSIGFRVRAYKVEEARGQEPRIVTFTAVDLIETSLVTEPANPDARITGVRGYDPNMTIADFEELLRSLDFPNKAAKSIAAAGFRAEPRDVAAQPSTEQPRDAGQDEETVARMIRDLNARLRGAA